MEHPVRPKAEFLHDLGPDHPYDHGREENALALPSLRTLACLRGQYQHHCAAEADARQEALDRTLSATAAPE